MRNQSAPIVLTSEEALILYRLVSDCVSGMRPPEGRKGTKNVRSFIRAYDSILAKLRSACPELETLHQLSGE